MNEKPEWKYDDFGHFLLIEKDENGKQIAVCIISSNFNNKLAVVSMHRSLSQTELQELINMLWVKSE